MSYVRTYTITWTAPVGNLGVSNGNADDVPTVMDFSHCTNFYAEWDTVGATTGAPNFDFHLVSSADGVNWINTAAHTTLASAVAKNVRDANTLNGANIPLANAKATLDVNNAVLTAAEFVVLRIVMLNE
jgi:hypothetical protein